MGMRGTPVSSQSPADLFLYVALPYLALASFALGHVWRYRFDKFGWTSRSSEIYEKRWLEWGGPLFHYGAFMVIAGHVLGIVVPVRVTAALGISESQYEILAKSGGVTGLALCAAGLFILLVRRIRNGRVRRATSRMDIVALSLLWAMLILGALTTVGYNILGPGYDYRVSVAVWWRSILLFRPDVGALDRVPEIYRIHISVAWVFLAVFPFTRFVHAWSAPVQYLTRPYVVYRRREPIPPQTPGTSRGWQTFGRD